MNSIFSIGEERIRKAGIEIKAATPLTTQNLDVGFRVFKVDETNMEDVYYSPVEYTQEMIGGMVSNIKPDRSDLDLLFGCLLDWGLPLSLPYHSETIDGCTVHTYAPGDAELDVRDALIACFDSNVPENVIKEIAARKPLRAVFRDSSFASSPEKINVEEIFAMLTPDTKVQELLKLQSVGVDISNDMPFGVFVQQWYDVYKKPYLREKSQDITKYIVKRKAR